jgi:lysyl-tRNA synthetase class II
LWKEVANAYSELNELIKENVLKNKTVLQKGDDEATELLMKIS